jgi:hypothetical protein
MAKTSHMSATKKKIAARMSMLSLVSLISLTTLPMVAVFSGCEEEVRRLKALVLSQLTTKQFLVYNESMRETGRRMEVNGGSGG